MKDLRQILEAKETDVTIEPWADFIKIDMASGQLEYLAVKEVKDEKIKKLKLGESLMEDDFIYTCITDLSALDEK